MMEEWEKEQEILEELFFEQNFELGDNKGSIQKNVETAEALYQQSYKELEHIAELMEDGLWFDMGTAILNIQVLALSERFLKKFKSDLTEEI